ncbi:glyoxalase [Gordonia sp. CPCC 205333]|uniref:glyoxalase n=1 Tax=Gordonia sp. CPCC 205333 TaxID=3140790 RepID=UPI003AF3945B
MTTINALTLEVSDVDAAKRFYEKAFGLDGLLRFAQSDAPTNGFRGVVLSLVVADPAVVDSLFEPAIAAGATEIKPAKKSLWGYGASLQAPDGTVWTIASSSKKPTGAPLRVVDDLVVLIGADDVAESKQFYVDKGMTVAKSFGRKYVEFDGGDSRIRLALNPRKAAAKNAGVPAEGSGPRRLVINSDAGDFTDPDGNVWA